MGGGRGCSFRHLLNNSPDARVVAVDISADELALNEEVDEKRVADVSKGLPFQEGEVGLLASRTLLEHVSDVGAFFEHASRALCDGGYTVHLVPCKYAPFAILARLIPFPIVRWMLQSLRPETRGIVEFPAFYDKCTYSISLYVLECNDFSVVHTAFSYYQSDYFDAFIPAYLVSTLYELVVSAINARNLATYMLVVAQKRTEA